MRRKKNNRKGIKKFKSHNFLDYIFVLSFLFFLHAKERIETFFSCCPPKSCCRGRYQHKKYLFYFYDYCVSLLLSHMNIILEYEMNFPCKTILRIEGESAISLIASRAIFEGLIYVFDLNKYFFIKRKRLAACHERLLTDYSF